MAGNPNWEKGKSGNPGGRPKGRTIEKGIRERLQDESKYWEVVDATIAGYLSGNPKDKDTIRYAMDGPMESKLSIDAMLTTMTPEQKLEVMLAAKRQLDALESADPEVE